jgi:hypothetical protein
LTILLQVDLRQQARIQTNRYPFLYLKKWSSSYNCC